ncbi:hypothetical protein ScPMuIL_000636 [Solemya velum]
MSSQGRVFVYGGKGALGSTVVKFFKSKNYWVGSIDLTANEEADANVVVKPAESWTEQEVSIGTEVESLLGDNKLDAVLCVAGGWAGGNASSKTLVKNADLMWKQSVWTSVVASSLAAKHLKDGGLITLPGAQPALEGTPGMIGYGLAKAAVHQLVKSLAADKSGLPPNCSAIGILPVTLDTPMNRKWMPDADHSTWTPLEFIAQTFYNWSIGEGRPESGSLLQLITKEGKTELVSTA